MNKKKMLSMLLIMLALTMTIGGLARTMQVQAKGGHTAEHFTETVDETIPAAATCSGEDVRIFGVLDLTVQNTTDSKGGVHSVFHVTPHLTAIGVTSGSIYHTAGPLQSVTNSNGTGNEFQLINVIVLISPGSTNNLVLHETIHVTVNANGDTTVDFDNFRADCRG